jgi:hypothetical protein
MTRYEVRCVRKTDRYNPHERIHGVGGLNPEGTRWYATQGQMIVWIETGQYDFLVRVDHREVRVIVAVSRYGYKYIKTEPDGEQPNNLLSLPECP